MDDKKYPYKDLTYKIIGAVYDTVNELGYGYQEKYYQRGIEIKLESGNYKVEREKYLPIKFEEKIIGRYHIDFVINKVLVLEIKVANEFYENHIKQVLGYLKSGKYKIGLIALITASGVKIKRLIN